MNLRDFLWQRRQCRQPARMDSQSSQRYRPLVEALEVRDCPSVVAPTGLNATASSSTQVQLTWNDVANESGYLIYRWDGTKAIAIGNVAANTTTFNVSGLTAFHQYYFTVQAYDRSSTATAAWASVVTQRDPITAPTNVQVGSISNTQMTLTWTPVANATSYKIYEWDGGQWISAGSVAGSTALPGAQSFTVRNLTPGVTYYFEVQSVNATNAAMSGVVNGTTTAPSLTAPTNVKAHLASNTSVQVSWDPASGATGYILYRWQDGSAAQPAAIATLSGSTTSYIDTTVLSGKKYWYYVQSTRFSSTANSVWVNLTTPAGQVLVKPANFKITALNAYDALLSWDASPGAAGYRVYYWTGSSWTLLSTQAQGTQPGPQQLRVNGLESHQTHWFLVQAFTEGNAQFANSDMKFVNL